MKTLKNGYKIEQTHLTCYMFMINRVINMIPKEPKTFEEAMPGVIAASALYELWKHTENEDHRFTEETNSILTKGGLMDKSTGQVNEDIRQIVSQYIKFEGASLSTRNPLQEDSDDDNSKVAATTQP